MERASDHAAGIAARRVTPIPRGAGGQGRPRSTTRARGGPWLPSSESPAAPVNSLPAGCPDLVRSRLDLCKPKAPVFYGTYPFFETKKENRVAQTLTFYRDFNSPPFLDLGARRGVGKAIGAVVGVNSGRRGRSRDPAPPAQALRCGFGGAAGRRHDRMEGQPSGAFGCTDRLGADKISASLAR
jgi:hypothetical protein